MNTKPPPTTLLHDLRSLPGQYWILFSGTLVNRFGHFVIPFLTIYLRQSGFDAKVIGFTLGSYGAGALVAGILGGYLSDKIGRKPTMLISCAGASLSMLLLSQAHSVEMLIPVTFMTGLLNVMYGPAASALIADLVPPELRVRAFSCQRLAINFGFAAGMSVAGFMAKHSFMTLFVVDAATTLLLGFTILFGLKSTKISSHGKTGWSHALMHIQGNTAFKYAASASFLISVVFLQMSSSFGLHIVEGAHLDERAYGLIMAMNGLMIVFFELPITSYTRTLKPVSVMAVGYALIGLGMGLNLLGTTFSILIMSMLIFTIGEIIALPISNSYMAGLAPDEMRGRYQGALSVTWSGASMIAPPLGLSLYQTNPTFLWIGSMCISCIAAVLMLASTPWLRFTKIAKKAGSAPVP